MKNVEILGNFEQSTWSATTTAPVVQYKYSDYGSIGNSSTRRKLHIECSINVSSHQISHHKVIKYWPIFLKFYYTLNASLHYILRNAVFKS